MYSDCSGNVKKSMLINMQCYYIIIKLVHVYILMNIGDEWLVAVFMYYHAISEHENWNYYNFPSETRDVFLFIFLVLNVKSYRMIIVYSYETRVCSVFSFDRH